MDFEARQYFRDIVLGRLGGDLQILEWTGILRIDDHIVVERRDTVFVGGRKLGCGLVFGTEILAVDILEFVVAENILPIAVAAGPVRDGCIHDDLDRRRRVRRQSHICTERTERA